MRLGFSIGSVEVTIFDTDTTDVDCSELSDEEICDLVGPPMAGDEKWEPLSQAAYEEAAHRGMLDYS
jgi:hypothetical protein